MTTFNLNYIWDRDELISLVYPVISKKFPYSYNDVVNNYNKIINDLSSDDLHQIAQLIFIKYDDQDRIVYHPYLTAFAISRGLSRDTFVGWLSSDYPSINLHLYIKNFLLDGIFLLIPSSINVSEVITNFVNNKVLRLNYNNFLFIDGDNVQSNAIPIYRGLINIKSFSFFVQTIIPQFIEGYQQLYGLNNNSIVLSYATKKDAADVDLNIISTLVVNYNLRQEHQANYYIVTNDQYANEIELANNDIISHYPNNHSVYQWYDQKDKNVQWNYQDYDIMTGDLLHNLNMNTSFSTWFIRLIKENLSLNPIDLYRDIFTLVRQSNNFDDLYKLIKNLSITESQKDNLFSQYLVLTSSRFFSFDDLRLIVKVHFDYLLNTSQFDLNTFLNLPINPIIYFFYPGSTFNDLLINYADFRYIFGITQITKWGNVITSLS